MSVAKVDMIEDAMAAGYQIRHVGESVVILKVSPTGRSVKGLILYPDGTAFDIAVDLSAAKGVRSYKDMRKILGI